MIRRNKVLGVLGAAALIGVGCSGSIDGNSAADSRGGRGSGSKSGNGSGGKAGVGDIKGDETPANPTAGSLDDSAARPGAAPLRRMTLLEYKNTVRDLLGIKDSEVPVDGSFPQDLESANSGFVTGSSFSTGDDARMFMKAADALGALAAAKLKDLLPCKGVPSAAAEQDACAKDFIAKFGLRAFRRPLSQLEVDRLYAFYVDQKDPAKGGMKFEEAISAVVSAMLQTPYFLYHWELGPNKPIVEPSGLVRYNPYEIASRLSYMLWATMPDNDLLQQAANGGLTSPEQIEKAARRLLADDRAQVAVQDFHLQWLAIQELEGLDKDPSYTRYSAATAASMAKETQAFVNNLFFGPQATGSMKELLTSSTSFIDANLAKVYDVKNFTGGDTLTKTQLDPTQRAGILTLGSFLAVKANPDFTIPPRRGNAVLNRVLCMDMKPPANLMVPPAAADDGKRTTRQRFEVHGQAACAQGCHNFIDPVGFAFENYDAIGAWRPTENGQPVNAASEVQVGADKVAFTNAVDLMGKLAARPEVSECIAAQWLRYGLRRVDDMGDLPSVMALQNQFKAKSYDMRELVVAVTKSRAFTHRSLSEEEVAR